MTWPRGGYSLCDGWYICAAVLTPFFHFGRIEHDLFGVFFSSTNSKAIFWGTKTTNFFTKIDLFGPKFKFFLDLFGSNFQRPAAHPHQFSGRVPPPGTWLLTQCYGLTVWLFGSIWHAAKYIGDNFFFLKKPFTKLIMSSWYDHLN